MGLFFINVGLGISYVLPNMSHGDVHKIMKQFEEMEQL